MNFAHAYESDTELPPSEEEIEDAASTRTDAANADAFVRAYPNAYLYVVEWETWLAWDSKRWVLPGGKSGARDRIVQGIIRCTRLREIAARTTLRALETQLEAVLAVSGDTSVLDKSIKSQLRELTWLEQSQMSSRVSACEQLLRGRLAVSQASLDAQPWRLNVANGTLDLRTGDLYAHDRTDLLTQLTPIEYDRAALSPAWETFLDRAMGGSVELVAFLRRLVGYNLTGQTTEHSFAFHYGSGANGKSTFLSALRDLLGEYSCAAPRTLLIEPRNGAETHPAELARLHGKRLATCPEIPEGSELSEAKVKDLTGGDTIAVRRMNENWWDLRPTHKLHAAGNHKPIVKGTDLGIWRRIMLVPWIVTIPEAERDATLGDRIRAELPGVLAWAVQGCLEWRKDGLRPPAAVVAASEEYREESDILADWMDTLTWEPDAKVPMVQLYKSYRDWALELGQQPWSARRLAARLREKGARKWTARVEGKPAKVWLGVRIKTTMDRVAEEPN